MVEKVWLYSWNEYSEGAKAFAQNLNIKRIKHENSKFKGNQTKLVINWGASNLPSEISKCRILNPPSVIKYCSDKLEFFKKVSGKVSVPDWTNDPQVALKWIADGAIICIRTILNGHSAAGLIVVDKDNIKDFVEAPLYTRYMPKKDEYRVHVIRDDIIDVQKKILPQSWYQENEDKKPNFRIRNYANGFIFVRGNINPPQSLLEEAIKTIAACELDFGAVDIIWSEKEQKPYVLEVNTAPGIENSTVQNYTEAFKKVLKDI